MLLLFESPAGYAIFKVLDESKLLQESDDLYRDFQSPESAAQIVKLKHFEKFNDTTEALAASTAAIEGKVPKILKKVIKKHLEKDTNEKILVLDAKLGAAIKEKFNVPCAYDTPVKELIRCVRSQLDSLMSGMQQKENTAMTLGLAHALSTYKLKFSPDKIDIMIVHAVCLLDDLDKELNNYIMRCREWYGWHFPELSTIITDNLAYVKTIMVIGTRENTAQADLSDILPEDVEERVKEAAEISMGTEISEVDIKNIFCLCEQIIELSRYRTELYDYLKARMMALAPNLTILVGDMVGARLISHAGSLINLAKHPASTVQILGAEKALFRALKTKKDTPKYGLIYHAQLVGQSSARNKGKMSRMLAAKASLAIRVDALGDENTTVSLGAEHKVKLEARLRQLEQGNDKRLSGTGKAKAKLQKYYQTSEGKPYPDAADSTLPSMAPKKLKKPKIEDGEQGETSSSVKIEEVVEGELGEEATVPKKKKKKAKHTAQTDDGDVAAADIVKQENDVEQNGEGEKVKKRKKKHQEDPPADLEVNQEDLVETPPKKKKKKNKNKPETS